ncbi:MAG: argininosuccinate lyase [Bacteroidota bacterium]
MKLWDKGTDLNRQIEAFTVGRDRELDLELAPWDVLGTLAHITMLTEIGLLEKHEFQVLRAELWSIYRKTLMGSFEIEEGVEDVHSQVEMMLTEKLGTIGKKVHSGRSRNDQVLVDLKLYFIHTIERLVAQVEELFTALQLQAERYKDHLLPGYTHMQVAMPSSFGLWFGAYAEALIDDVQMLAAAFKVADQNPLGSGAGYGSSFPLNRTRTTELLGFETLSYNVVYAQMGRGKTERLYGYALASLASTLNKFASDACTYMSQNMGFISLPDELTTGSSIMPHKKNPDVFEILRARTNRLQGLPQEMALITTNLPSGYHRDLQLTKEVLLPAITETKLCLEIMTFMVGQIQVKPKIMEDPKYAYTFSVEVVNALVLKGIPFREAYQMVGKSIEKGEFLPPQQVKHTHEGSIGQLNQEEIKQKFEKAKRQMDIARFDQAWENLLK